MSNSDVFLLEVWRILDDKTITPACSVDIIYQPETDSLHLLLSEEDMDELMEHWINAKPLDRNKDGKI